MVNGHKLCTFFISKTFKFATETTKKKRGNSLIVSIKKLFCKAFNMDEVDKLIQQVNFNNFIILKICKLLI